MFKEEIKNKRFIFLKGIKVLLKEQRLYIPYKKLYVVVKPTIFLEFLLIRFQVVLVRRTFYSICDCFYRLKKFIHSFILIYSQKSYKTLKYICTYTLTHKHRHTCIHMHTCVYIVYAYARVHIQIIIYISTAILRENKTCRRLRVLSSSPGNILK